MLQLFLYVLLCFIGSGYCNCVTGACGTIGGGARNKACSQLSFIGNGTDNTTGLGFTNNFIGSGNQNAVNSSCSAIVGGANNNTSSHYSFIGGGVNNFISTPFVNGVIGGGWNNEVISCYSSIVGGECNCIVNAAMAGVENHNFIGGGCHNLIGITHNTGSCFSSIVGGCTNCIEEGFFNSILGGGENYIPVGFDYSSVVGCRVIPVTSCAFHANQLVSQNICDASFTLPPTAAGLIYTCTIGGRRYLFIV